MNSLSRTALIACACLASGSVRAGAGTLILSNGLPIPDGRMNEIEANDSLATAQALVFFSQAFSLNITNLAGVNTSTAIPHVTILGTGDGTFDYYQFDVALPGSLGIFDIDFGMPDVDTEIALFDANGTPLAENDDFFADPGTVPDEPIDAGAGSEHGYDSFIEFTFDTAGTYVIGVAQFPSRATQGGWDTGITLVDSENCELPGECPTEIPNSNPLPVGSDYTLHVSISSGPVVVPLPAAAPLLLTGIGLLGLRIGRRCAREGSPD